MASLNVGGKVVQVPMDLDYVYEDINGKDGTDGEDFTSASLAPAASKQSDKEEGCAGGALELRLIKNVEKHACEHKTTNYLDPPWAHKQRNRANANVSQQCLEKVRDAWA